MALGALVDLLSPSGPRLGNSPVPSIVQCLARKDGTDDFYQLKVRPDGRTSTSTAGRGQQIREGSATTAQE